MAPIRIFALVLLLNATALFGQLSAAPPSVDPPDPTSKDSVTLIIQQVASCPPPPEVTRSGFDITVILRPGPCLSPPSLVTQRVELGALPVGHYRVTVNGENALSFVVLDANSSVVVSQSIGSSAGGTTVNVFASAPCFSRKPSECAPVSISFGGLPAADVVALGPSRFQATTPPHAPGAVQVTVTQGSSVSSSYAFRYYDPTAAPSDKFFEKLLVPIIFNGPGAFSSKWVTDLSLRNDNDYAVEPWRPIGGSGFLAPGKPVLFGSGSAPSGLFLVLPRQAAGALGFHAAVRDTSRADREWAAQVPIAREANFSLSGVDLLDIPADRRFRTMVRVYSPINPVPTYAQFVHLIVYSLDDGGILRDIYPSLSDPTACSDMTSCAEHPSFASVSDLTAGLPSGRVGVQVQGNVPLWAFATVTNNDTQHVTIVSPQ